MAEIEYAIMTSDNAVQFNYTSSGTDHYVLIDDNVAGDPVGNHNDSDYVGNNDAANANDDFNHADYVLTSAISVTNISIVMRGSEPGSSTGQLRQLYYTGGGNRNNGNTENLTSTPVTFTYNGTINPETSSGYTVDEAKGIGVTSYDARIGARALTGVGEDARMQQLYGYCTYEVAAAGGNPWYYYAQQH